MENKSNNKSILTKIINFIDNKINRFLVMFSIALASTLIVFSMSNSNEKEVEASSSINLNELINTSYTSFTKVGTANAGDTIYISLSNSDPSCMIGVKSAATNNGLSWDTTINSEKTYSGTVESSYDSNYGTISSNVWDIYYQYNTDGGGNKHHYFKLQQPSFKLTIDDSACTLTGTPTYQSIYEYETYYDFTADSKYDGYMIADLNSVNVSKDGYYFATYKYNINNKSSYLSSPSISSDDIVDYFEDGRITVNGISDLIYVYDAADEGDNPNILHTYILFNQSITLTPCFLHIHNYVFEKDTDNNSVSFYCDNDKDEFGQCLYKTKITLTSDYYPYGKPYSDTDYNGNSVDEDRNINENKYIFYTQLNSTELNYSYPLYCMYGYYFSYSSASNNVVNEYNIYKVQNEEEITGGTLVTNSDYSKCGLNAGYYYLEAKLNLQLLTYGYNISDSYQVRDYKYELITLKFPFKINRCNNYASLSMSNYTYGSTPSTPSCNKSNMYEETDDITYYYNTVDQFATAEPWKDIDSTTLLPGTYYMYAKVGETKNCYKTISSAYTFTVNPLTFNPTFTGEDTVTYDGSEHTISIDSSSIPADTNVVYTISSLGSELLYSCPSAVDAGTYTITYTLSKEGYTTKTITKTLTINPIELTVDGIKAKDKVFDGTLNVELDYSEVVFKNSNGDEVTVNGLSVTAIGKLSVNGNAENKKVTNISNIALCGVNSINYVLASTGNQNNVECNVTKAKFTISGIVVGNKVFDTNTNATLDLTNIKYNGVVKGYEPVVDETKIRAEFSNCNANNNVLVNITFDGFFNETTDSINENYEFDLENSQTIAYANITPIELELTYSNLEAYYDGNAKNASYTYDSTKLIAGSVLLDSIVVNNGSDAINAGTYDVVVNWQNTNYNITNPTATLTINKTQAENITVEHHIMNITYGDTFDNYFHAYVNRKDLTNNNTDYVATYTTYSDSNLTTKVCDGLPTQAGTYYIKQVCKESLNLSEKTDSFELSVNKKDASISYSNLTAVYDSKDHMPVLTLEGILNDDVTASFKEEASKNAGTYTYNVEYTGLVDNYNITGETSCTLSIDQREVSIKLENLTKHINLSDPKFIYTIENDLDSSELEVRISRAQGELAGKYKIDANYVANPNYTVSSVTDDAYLTIEDHTYGDLVMLGNSNLYVRYCTNQDCCEHISQSKAQSEMKSVTSSTIISNGSTIEAASINNTEDSLKSSVFTASEINSGNKLSTWIQISDVDADSLDSQVKSLIESSATSVNKDLSRLKFMDISMYKSISSDTSTTVEKVTSSNSDQFEITLKLPSNMLKNKYRTYKVIRVHDSNVDTLDSTLDFDNGTITFTTDRFSNYAITYEDHLSPAQISGIVALVVLVILVILYIVFYFIKYRNHKLDNSKFKHIYSLPQKKNSNE